MATITDFKTSITNYGGDEVADVGNSNSEFIEWTNQSLVNRHEEICALSNKWTTDSETFTTKGYELDLPSDWDNMSEMLLYTDANHQENYDSWSVEFGKMRFNSEQSASKTYYRRYRQMPTVYTAMGDTLVEYTNPRLRKILMDEVIGLFYASDNDQETSNAEENAKSKANDNS